LRALANGFPEHLRTEPEADEFAERLLAELALERTYTAGGSHDEQVLWRR
jgi:hypothetical protein